MEEDYVDPEGEGSLTSRRGGEETKDKSNVNDIRKRHWYPDDEGGEMKKREKERHEKVGETNFQVSLVSGRAESAGRFLLRPSP